MYKISCATLLFVALASAAGDRDSGAAPVVVAVPNPGIQAVPGAGPAGAPLPPSAVPGSGGAANKIISPSVGKPGDSVVAAAGAKPAAPPANGDRKATESAAASSSAKSKLSGAKETAASSASGSKADRKDSASAESSGSAQITATSFAAIALALSAISALC
ncbi:hypothetical protein GGI23_000102 [Coemansia sp. RSA 2559]|nr:hypothetical protein GGI23_000102 [Coemansia sp. RSA 2559]KAJ2869493.1 hypothetical protein GGI22_000210 [Coemansia erecta]